MYLEGGEGGVHGYNSFAVVPIDVCQQKLPPLMLSSTLTGFESDENDDQNYSTDKSDDVEDLGCSRRVLGCCYFTNSIGILCLEKETI